MTRGHVRRIGSYGRLFAARAVGLASTGIAVVALALVAFDVAGDDAGTVLGTALAIKALGALLAPFAFAALARRLPPGPLLLAADLGRAVAIGALALSGTAWQILVAVGIFSVFAGIHKVAYNAAAATLLPDEEDYAAALAKSRVLDETEALFTALLAAALVLVTSPAGVLWTAAGGFSASAAIAATVPLGRTAEADADARGRLAGLVSAILGHFRAPTLRPVPLLLPAAAAASAMVTVNTVVIVQGDLGLGERETTIALVAFGIGTATGALAAPTLLARIGLRATTLSGAFPIPAVLLAGTAAGGYAALLALWALLGAAAALVQLTLTAFTRENARPGAVGATFAGGLVLWNLALVAGNAIAGWTGAAAGSGVAFAILAAIAAVSALAAALGWPPAAARATLERKTAE